MNIQENTEFIIGKVDSLFKQAMPYLQKGGEELITYKVIQFRVDFIIYSCISFFLTLIFTVVLVKCIKGLIKTPQYDDDSGYSIGVMISGFFLFVTIFVSILKILPLVSGFVLSFTNPEVFAIMQLLGK